MSDQVAKPDAKRLGGGVIASLVGLGVLVVFVLQNREDVTFTFLFLEFTWPMWLYTIVIAIVGALIWFGLGVMRRHRRRQARRD
ncbi:MAG: LapA family protein [Actinomycetota bacterium]|nr:LapA family protein [Actinomycetota bacterium]